MPEGRPRFQNWHTCQRPRDRNRVPGCPWKQGFEQCRRGGPRCRNWHTCQQGRARRRRDPDQCRWGPPRSRNRHTSADLSYLNGRPVPRGLMKRWTSPRALLRRPASILPSGAQCTGRFEHAKRGRCLPRPMTLGQRTRTPTHTPTFPEKGTPSATTEAGGPVQLGAGGVLVGRELAPSRGPGGDVVDTAARLHAATGDVGRRSPGVFRRLTGSGTPRAVPSKRDIADVHLSGSAKPGVSSGIFRRLTGSGMVFACVAILPRAGCDTCQREGRFFRPAPRPADHRRITGDCPAMRRAWLLGALCFSRVPAPCARIPPRPAPGDTARSVTQESHHG